MSETAEVKAEKAPRPWIAWRKSLRSKAEKEHGRKTDWRGGILYFSGTKECVPGVPHVPKEGKKVVGWRGAVPKPGPGYGEHSVEALT